MTKKTSIGVRSCVSFFLALLIAPNIEAAKWNGSENERDGILHVVNPAEPIEQLAKRKTTKLWEIGGDDEAEYLFGVLSQIDTDRDGNLYLLDSQLNEVLVFSASGEYLRSIGREGEGPGEFRRPSDLFVTASGDIAVLQRMPGKIVLLSPEGEPIGTHATPEATDGGMQMFGGGKRALDQLVLSVQQFARRDDGVDITSSIVRVNENGEQTATYHHRSTSRDFSNMAFSEKTGFGSTVWSVGQDGRVFVSPNFDGYRIGVWAANGEVDRVIERSYEPRVRSAKERELNKPRVRFRRRGRTQRPNVEASDTDRDIQQLFPRADGTLWALSSHGAFDAGADLGTFDVFDREGKFTHQVTLAGEGDYQDDAYHIVGDRLYVVTDLRAARRAAAGSDDDENVDEDAEPMRVICYDLAQVVQTKN